MGTLTNSGPDDLGEITLLNRGLAKGETIEVPDELLAAHPFQYPPFEVNGVQRLGPFLDGDDFLKQDAERATAPPAEDPPPVADPATPQE